MGWRAFQEGLMIRKEIHEGLHGLACILGGIEKEVHEGLHGLALRRKFMRVCMGWEGVNRRRQLLH